MNVGGMPRRILGLSRWVSYRLFVLSVWALNVLALTGFFARDPSRWLGLLMCLPLALIGFLTVIITVGFMKPASRPTHALLLATGLFSTVVGASWMIGWRTPAQPRPEDQRLRLLHWNVGWDGLALEGRTPWDDVGKEIIDKEPDLIILSEAPFKVPLYRKLDELPGRHFGLSVLSPGKMSHFFHTFVAAKWPLYLERWVTIAGGGAAVVLVSHPARHLRILVVDGNSNIAHSRTPMLHGLAEACTRADKEGAPIDLIVGDFNAVSRSLGFDELSCSGGGYQLASRFRGGWRASWPSWFPILDIDHVWARAGWLILGCRFFTNHASDHRGQVVELVIPE